MAFDKVVSWNMKVGRNVETVLDQLQSLISDTQPDVVCLQEAKGYIGRIKDRFGTGGGGKWNVYAYGDWEESRDDPVMVWAKGREWQTYGEGWGTLRYTTKWVGPQGGSHKGRTWTWVDVDGVRVMSLHRCTDGNGKNKAAFVDEYDAIVPWLRNHEPVLIVGDHNCGVGATYKGASKNIAVNTGSYLCHCSSDSGIDYGIRHGIKVTGVKRGKAYGSDHECTIYTVDCP